MSIAAKAFRVHSIQSGQVEGVQYLGSVTSQTFKLGEVLIWGTAGNAGLVTVAGADPANNTIVGIALQAADTSPGFAAANFPTVFTGRSQKVSVARPTDNVIFQGELTNSSSTVIAPAVTDRGLQYGITAYSGIWTVDKGKTGGSARVNIIDIDTDQNVVFFKFILPAAP